MFDWLFRCWWWVVDQWTDRTHDYPRHHPHLTLFHGKRVMVRLEWTPGDLWRGAFVKSTPAARKVEV